jgi:hypothetical protein
MRVDLTIETRGVSWAQQGSASVAAILLHPLVHSPQSHYLAHLDCETRHQAKQESMQHQCYACSWSRKTGVSWRRHVKAVWAVDWLEWCVARPVFARFWRFQLGVLGGHGLAHRWRLRSPLHEKLCWIYFLPATHENTSWTSRAADNKGRKRKKMNSWTKPRWYDREVIAHLWYVMCWR